MSVSAWCLHSDSAVATTSSRQLGRSLEIAVGPHPLPEHEADVLGVIHDRVREPPVQFLRERRLARAEPAVDPDDHLAQAIRFIPGLSCPALVRSPPGRGHRFRACRPLSRCLPGVSRCRRRHRLSGLRSSALSLAGLPSWGQAGCGLLSHGLTGAGKTSFGHELAAALRALGRPTMRASMDDFKHPWRHARKHGYDRVSGEGYYRNAYDFRSARDLLLGPAGPCWVRRGRAVRA